MHEGAQDFLCSASCPPVLRRSIRYAVERKRAIDSLAVRDATQRGILDALRESVAVLNRAGIRRLRQPSLDRLGRRLPRP